MALAVEKIKVVDAALHEAVLGREARRAEIARGTLGAVHAAEVDEELIVHKEPDIIITSEGKFLGAL